MKIKYSNLPKSVKASMWFTVCSILQKGISFVTVPVYTRMLSVDEYGIISLYGAWQSTLAVFATLNLSSQIFNNGMVKFEKDQDGYTTAMLGLSNLVSLFLFGIYLAFHVSLNRLFELPTAAMVMMFVGYFFSSATSLWTVHQRYKYRYRLLCVITLGITLGSAILGILLVQINPVGLSKIFADTLIVALIGILVYGFILRKNRKVINWPYWKYALKLDIPLIPHYMAMTVLGSSDRIMINNMCGNSFTALYSVPYNASMVMQIVINSICASFIPWTYQKCRGGEYKKLNELSSFLLIFVGVLTLIPSLFAPELVWLLGSSEYRDSMWVVPPVSCSVFFMFLYSLFTNIEMYYEKSKNIMIASIVVAVCNIILNFFFINLFGYIAAAYTTLACYILLSLVHYVNMMAICKEKNIDEKIYNTKLIVVISLFLVLYSILVTFLFEMAGVIRYIIIAAIVLVMYVKRKLIFDKLNIRNEL